MTEYKPNELFIYTNGGRWELGQVKSECVDGKAYFCWYSCGDTAARTPIEHMHKLANAGWTRVEDRIDQLEQLVRYMYRCYVQGHDWGVWGAPEQQWVEQRMYALGLLEVDNGR